MKAVERSIHDELLKNSEVKVFYRGDCRGCGECCSRFLPLSNHDIKRIKDFAAEHDIEQAPERAEIDLLCPYLTDERMCAIYDARPDICRIYRCDLHKAGVFHAGVIMPHHPYLVQDLREAI